MAHITRIIYPDGSNVFNYTARDRDDFLHTAMQKYGWPVQGWNWEILTTPPAESGGAQNQLAQIAVTRAGETQVFSTGDPDRPGLLAVAWQWITDGAELVEEWQGEFILTKGQGRVFRRFDHIGPALDAAAELAQWDIFLTDARGEYGEIPLFSG